MTQPPKPDVDPVLQWVAEYASAYRRSLAERAVAAPSDSEAIARRLAELGPLPAQGLSALDCLRELVQLADPGITAMSGPRFMGWVVGGTLPAALAADWLTSAWDQNAGTGEGAPAATAFENAALHWVIDCLQLPRGVACALVTGAMAANFTCMAAARGQLLEGAGWDVQQRGLFGAPPLHVLVGHERHETIDKAAKLLGLGKQSIRCLQIDAQGRMRPAALRRALQGLSGPVLVCAQAGNVNSGAFDPLDAIAGCVEEYRERNGPSSIWLHVDGAFGLWARACTAGELSKLALGAERADSWATDAHKVLNVPYDSGIALCRDLRALRRAMEIGGAYLDSGGDRPSTYPGMLVPELSRRARGFVLWAALRQLGRDGLAALVARYAHNARTFARALSDSPTLSVVNELCFNQVVVQLHGQGEPQKLATQQLVRALQAEGTCYATPSNWRGKPVIRFSFCNADTTEADALAAARALLATAERA